MKKKLNIGLVGYGFMGRTHTNAFLQAPRYFDLPNVFMLPHIGSSTIETRRRMARGLIESLEQWRAGSDPVNRLA